MERIRHHNKPAKLWQTTKIHVTGLKGINYGSEAKGNPVVNPQQGIVCLPIGPL